MRTLLNLVWLVLAGFWLALGYVLAGVLCFILIITIPAGVASFRMARYVLWPFGKAVVPMEHTGALSAVSNVIWFVIAGWWLAIAHVVAAFAQALSIIGVLNAVVSLKMIPVCCFPFGKQIVDRERLAPGARPLHSI